MKIKYLTLGSLLECCQKGWCKDCPFNPDEDENPKGNKQNTTWLCSVANSIQLDAEKNRVNLEEDIEL